MSHINACRGDGARRRFPLTIGLMAVVASIAVSLAGATSAWAAAQVAITPSFPVSVTVGDQNVPTTLQVQNVSNGAQAGDSLGIDAITLTPSCGSSAPQFACPAGSEDPGVFQPSTTAIGEAGSGCAGSTFTISLQDPPSGRYAITPSAPPLILAGPGSSTERCIIDFTVNVLKAPTKDSSVNPGLQTVLEATAQATDISPASEGQTTSAFGTRSTNVAKATAPLATQVSNGSITLGQSFTDTALVAKPAGGPAVTGTVTFNVFGPGDPNCAGAPISTMTSSVFNGTATSGTFTPTATGTYRVVASYSGDANYSAVSGTCGQPGEQVTVSPAGPVVTTGAATSITGSGATLPGTVNPNGLSTTYVFEYGPTLSFGSITPPASAGSGTSPVAVSANVTGLAPGTTYYYRVVATNSSGTTSGTVRSFRTTGTAQPPVAITGAASAITTSGATLNGQVNPKGLQTSYTFEYGRTTAFGQITPVVALDSADALEPVSAALTGLAPNTTYVFRTVASNAAGTSRGAVGTFTTGPGGGPPIVATGAATSVIATGATLNATVNPSGSSTSYTFEYGTTTGFGSLSAVGNAGSANGANPVAQSITGLSANTTYFYRVVATNASGTANGVVKSFTTPGPAV